MCGAHRVIGGMFGYGNRGIGDWKPAFVSVCLLSILGLMLNGCELLMLTLRCFYVGVIAYCTVPLID